MKEGRGSCDGWLMCYQIAFDGNHKSYIVKHSLSVYVCVCVFTKTG